MKVLIVASYNKGYFAPFILEQAEAIQKVGCEIEFLGLQGKGLKGYGKNLPLLKQKIREFRPDIIHAHYGLSGLLANLQRNVPVVTTYHGSDINNKKVLPYSKLAIRWSAWNIFVSKKIMGLVNPPKKSTLLPCGVDLSDLQLMEKTEARRRLFLDLNKHYVLFAGAFDNPVKNASLAQETVTLLHDGDVELLELKGYSREKVALLMCAADSLLMTSLSEGSPQVIKEAMACGCPIVSVDVGDVKERTEGVKGCYLSATRNPIELVGLLDKALYFQCKTCGREKIVVDGLDNRLVAERLHQIYRNVLKY